MNLSSNYLSHEALLDVPWLIDITPIYDLSEDLKKCTPFISQKVLRVVGDRLFCFLFSETKLVLLLVVSCSSELGGLPSQGVPVYVMEICLGICYLLQKVYRAILVERLKWAVMTSFHFHFSSVTNKTRDFV